MSKAFANANYFWAFIAVIIALLSHIIRAARWKLIIKSIGYNVSLLNATWAILFGFLSNAIIPRSGEILRCGALGRKEKVPVEKLIGTVIAERFVDLIMLIGLVIGTVYFQRSFIENLMAEKIMPGLKEKMAIFTNLTAWLVLAVTIILLVLLLFMLRKMYGRNVVTKLNKIKSGILEGVKSLFKLKNPLTFILQTFAMWTAYFLSGFVVFRALKDTAHLGIDAGFTCLTMGSIGMLVPAPNGLGSYHYFVGEALKLYNIAEGAAFAYPWIVWTANTMVIIVGGLLALRSLWSYK